MNRRGLLRLGALTAVAPRAIAAPAAAPAGMTLLVAGPAKYAESLAAMSRIFFGSALLRFVDGAVRVELWVENGRLMPEDVICASENLAARITARLQDEKRRNNR